MRDLVFSIFRYYKVISKNPGSLQGRYYIYEEIQKVNLNFEL